MKQAYTYWKEWNLQMGISTWKWKRLLKEIRKEAKE